MQQIAAEGGVEALQEYISKIGASARWNLHHPCEFESSYLCT